MGRLALLALVAAALGGCRNTGNSSADQEALSKQWNQDAYEQAMIKAGKEDELKAEKEKWAASGQGGQQEEQGP